MDCDFLVIGGGIAGLSAGANLSLLGRVLVLEAENAIGFHASGRSAALFVENYGNASIVALNRASREVLETADGGVLTPRGILVLAAPGEEALFADDAKSMSLAAVTPREAAAKVPLLNPAAITGAGYSADVFDIDTNRYLQHFARAIRAGGGRIETGARVERLERSDGVWRASAAGANYRAPVLVNAAGAWADRVAALAGVAPLGLCPCRRSVARIVTPAGHNSARWPMLMGPGENWYAKPDAGGLIVSPADEEPAEPHDAWADDLVLAEGIARFEAVANAPVTRLLASWAGLRTFAPDRSLVLGPDPDCPSFIWVAGQGGYGFQTAAAAGGFIGDIVAGRPPALEPALQAALLPGRLRG